MSKSLLIASFAALALCRSATGAALYTDDFNTNGTDSPPWGNQRGNWSAGNGVYSAANPSNNPTTYSSLTGFDLADFSFQVDVNDVSDGGIWLRSDFNGGNINGVLLVIGGQGYGSGNRGPHAGEDMYWHISTNGNLSTGVDLASFVLSPGEDVTVRVDVVGNTYRAYVNGTLETTLVDNTYSHGQVGLYDYYSGLSFDNVVLSTVPEPTSAAVFGSLFVGMVACLRPPGGRRRN
ncbi:MAG TPA: hypothetical protein VG826_36225 [Pirellulales bacterium]|nr:hypothetical protein [Pirellulales bacterium]